MASSFGFNVSHPVEQKLATDYILGVEYDGLGAVYLLGRNVVGIAISGFTVPQYSKVTRECTQSTSNWHR